MAEDLQADAESLSPFVDTLFADLAELQESGPVKEDLSDEDVQAILQKAQENPAETCSELRACHALCARWQPRAPVVAGGADPGGALRRYPFPAGVTAPGYNRSQHARANGAHPSAPKCMTRSRQSSTRFARDY